MLHQLYRHIYSFALKSQMHLLYAQQQSSIVSVCCTIIVFETPVGPKGAIACSRPDVDALICEDIHDQSPEAEI